jgi:hypothetical protein
MSVQRREPPASVAAFAPKQRPSQVRSVPADDAGNGIVALVHKAAEAAKEDCARAMDLAHKLSFQLRAAEERARELEAEADHFRERAVTAEKWLVAIHNEVEQTFFQKKNGGNGHAQGGGDSERALGGA